MRIVVAPDSFKGSLSAAKAAQAIARGLAAALPDAEIVRVPLADGGEGTVEALAAALGGRIETVTVRDPFDRPVTAPFAWMPEAGLAAVEVAAASGLPLLAGDRPDPLRASSFGTGQLIRAALDRGARAILVGLGGSATVDGGSGVLEALGARFLDEHGQPLRACGGALARIAAVDLTGLDGRLREVAATAACDVTNPLLGPTGTVAVFGPQKGAGPAEQAELKAGMLHYADLLRVATGRDRRAAEGAGAAGGLGFALASVLDAELCSGFSLIADVAGLRARIAGADLVVTGEGRLDSQSLCGKAPVGVARMAAAAGVPAVAFAGSVLGDPEGFARQGIALAVPIVDSPMPLERAMTDAALLLEAAAARFAAALALGAAVRPAR